MLYVKLKSIIHILSFASVTSVWAGSPKNKNLGQIWHFAVAKSIYAETVEKTICKSEPQPRNIPCQHPTTQVIYRPDALPATQPTASKH